MLSSLEALLFAVGSEGLNKEELCNILEIEEKEVEELINKLQTKYEDEDSGIELKILGNNYKLVTKEKEKDYLKKLAIETSNNLSEPALETLAIIAYNEPITRSEIDDIRGINSTQMLRNLIAKGLIETAGKSEDTPGRPNLYKTTDYFLDYFNLGGINELPELDIDEIEVLEDDDLYHSKYKEDGE